MTKWRLHCVELMIVLYVSGLVAWGQCGTTWTVTYELSAKEDVAINPARLKHGPAAVVASNGDWLVAYQDSLDHGGTDAVISQVRSRDEGKTWKLDGIVYDQRKENYFGRNPAYGVTASGQIVLVVQRCRPLPPGVKFVVGKEEGIQGSVYLTSRDDGRTYENRGLVDPADPLRHQGTTSAIRFYDGQLYMIAISLAVPPYGATLYTTDDPSKGWHFSDWVFRLDQLPYSQRGYSYPSLVRRPDGALLAQIVNGSPTEEAKNFQSLSNDQGRTWTRPRELPGLNLGWNVDLDYAGKVLVAHGRGGGPVDQESYAAYFSPDDGQTWGCPIVLDRTGFCGGGGYGASLRTPEGDLFIVFSTDAGPHTCQNGGKPDIRGLFLRDVKIRRASDAH